MNIENNEIKYIDKLENDNTNDNKTLYTKKKIDNNFLLINDSVGKKYYVNDVLKGEIFNCYSGTNINVASGNYSHSEGVHNTASGNYSHCEGGYNTASIPYAHCEGYNNTSSNYYAHCEGNNNTASGMSSHCEGQVIQHQLIIHTQEDILHKQTKKHKQP